MDKMTYNKEPLNNHLEIWKHTNVNVFKDYKLKLKLNDKNIKPSYNSNEIIIYNGKVIKYGKYIKNKKIQIYNTVDAFKNNINNFKKKFNTSTPKSKNIYLDYNTLNYDKGYYIYIPKNTKLDKPIIIKNINDQGNDKLFSNYRNFIYCEDNVNATIFNEEIFPIQQCINIVCESYLNKNSQLEIINYNEKPQTKQIYHFSACINNNSKLYYHGLDTSSHMLKNNYYFNLNKPGSECFFNGLNIASNKEHHDNYIEIHHNSPYTISNINYKIIANKNAKSIVFPKSVINENSHHSEAYQKNNNLILSDKAMIHSNPQLEIYNDDVKCSHGSATGQIDEEAIHYMRTRGINEKNAKQLILNSFINKVIEKISHDNIQKIIKEKIKNLILENVD